MVICKDGKQVFKASENRKPTADKGAPMDRERMWDPPYGGGWDVIGGT